MTTLRELRDLERENAAARLRAHTSLVHENMRWAWFDAMWPRLKQVIRLLLIFSAVLAGFLWGRDFLLSRLMTLLT